MKNHLFWVFLSEISLFLPDFGPFCVKIGRFRAFLAGLVWNSGPLVWFSVLMALNLQWDWTYINIF